MNAPFHPLQRPQNAFQRLLGSFRRLPLEVWIWVGALGGLAVVGPSLDGHVTFCLPSWLGFEDCWGCGLGRSISRAFHGDLAGSVAAHPLGMVAIAIIGARIVELVRTSLRQDHNASSTPVSPDLSESSESSESPSLVHSSRSQS